MSGNSKLRYFQGTPEAMVHSKTQVVIYVKETVTCLIYCGVPRENRAFIGLRIAWVVKVRKRNKA